MKLADIENRENKLKVSEPDFIFTTFHKLPIEIKLMVAQKCSINQIAQAKLVSKNWYSIFTDSQVWQQQLKSYQNHIITKYSIPWPIPEPTHHHIMHPLRIILPRLKYIEKNHRGSFLQCFFSMNLQYTALWYKQLPIDSNWPNSTRSLEALIKFSAKYGNFALTQWLVENKFAYISDTLLDDAVSSGNRELAQWLINKKCCKPSDNTMMLAVRSGNLNLVKWLFYSKEVEQKMYLMSAAISSRKLSLVKWLIEVNQEPINYRLLFGAAKSGSLTILKWLIDDQQLALNEPVTNSLLLYAAESGNLKLVQWLMGKVFVTVNHCGGKGYLLSPNESEIRLILKNAVWSGNLILVQWLIKRYNIHNFERLALLEVAADSGNLHLLQWLLKQDYIHDNPTFTTLHRAIESGNLCLVQWLINEKYIEPNKKTLKKGEYYAVKNHNHAAFNWFIKIDTQDRTSKIKQTMSNN